MPKSRHRKKKTRSKMQHKRTVPRAVESAVVERPNTSGRVVHVIIPKPAPDNPLALIPRTAEGSFGTYLVTFVLCVPGQRVFQDHLNYPTLRDAGDSLLFVPSPIRDLRIQVSISHGFAEIVFTMNKRGAISHAITKIWANNFEDAAAKAYDIVVPTLSHLSFRFDIALDTLGFEIKEERTDVMFYSYGLLGRAKLFNNLESFSSVLEYRRFFSAYREALNSPNTFYQALSFSKVTEGVLAHRIRQKRASGSYVKDESGFLSTESFPETADEIGSDDDVGVGEFDIHLGKHFGEVHEHYRVLVRNAIAHLSKLDSVLDADTYEHISNCEKAVPVLKYMARRVLENDLATGKSREIEMTDG